MYAANRIDPNVQFTKEACSKLTKVPRIFLNKVLKGCVDWAIKHNVSLIEPKHIEQIQNKHADEQYIINLIRFIKRLKSNLTIESKINIILLL